MVKYILIFTWVHLRRLYRKLVEPQLKRYVLVRLARIVSVTEKCENFALQTKEVGINQELSKDV